MVCTTVWKGRRSILSEMTSQDLGEKRRENTSFYSTRGWEYVFGILMFLEFCPKVVDASGEE